MSKFFLVRPFFCVPHGASCGALVPVTDNMEKDDHLDPVPDPGRSRIISSSLTDRGRVSIRHTWLAFTGLVAPLVMLQETRMERVCVQLRRNSAIAPETILEVGFLPPPSLSLPLTRTALKYFPAKRPWRHRDRGRI